MVAKSNHSVKYLQTVCSFQDSGFWFDCSNNPKPKILQIYFFNNKNPRYILPTLSTVWSSRRSSSTRPSSSSSQWNVSLVLSSFWRPQWVLMSDGFIKLQLWHMVPEKEWRDGERGQERKKIDPHEQPQHDTLLKAIKRGKSSKVKTFRAREYVLIWAFLLSRVLEEPIHALTFSPTSLLSFPPCSAVVNTKNKSKNYSEWENINVGIWNLTAEWSTKDKVLASEFWEKSLFYGQGCVCIHLDLFKTFQSAC